jgi:hypothetical protein
MNFSFIAHRPVSFLVSLLFTSTALCLPVTETQEPDFLFNTVYVSLQNVPQFCFKAQVMLALGGGGVAEKAVMDYFYLFTVSFLIKQITLHCRGF